MLVVSNLDELKNTYLKVFNFGTLYLKLSFKLVVVSIK